MFTLWLFTLNYFQKFHLQTGESGEGNEGDVFDCGDEFDDEEEEVDDDELVDVELLDGFCSTLITNPFVFLFLRTNLPPT